MPSVDELCDIFYTSQKKGQVFRVKLNTRGFVLQRDSAKGSKEQLVSISDIVGGRTMRLPKSSTLGSSCYCSSSTRLPVGDEGDVCAYLYVFAYILKKNIRSVWRRERTVLTLRFRSFDSFDENIREAERWYKALKAHKLHAVNDLPSLSNGRLLVLLNPKAGSGKARELFHQQVIPILNEAEIAYDMHVTKHANFAREFVRLRNLGVWSAIVAVGGDGLLFEILNGILQRPDWPNILRRISLGIIPCGSGNGLARSIAHLYKEPYGPKPILGAALTIASGHTTSMDTVRVELQNQILYSFLSVGWGLLSDVDIESERLRSLGYQRFTLWTLHRLISLRTYRGKISYLVKNDATEETFLPEAQLPILKQSRSCHTYLDKTDCSYFQSADFIGSGEFDDVISLETLVNQSFRSRCDSWFSAGSRKSTYYSISESIYQSIAGESDFELKDNILGGYEGPKTAAPNLQDSLPDTWDVEEGDFVMVHAAYQTHLSSDCYFAPSAKLNDGTIFLVIIRGGISRSQLLNFLINMSSGTHLPTKNNEFIKVVTVTAFRIEPYEANGIITVDGERVEYGPLQAEIFPGITRVMVPK